MLNYQGALFRPPSEANSLILQATLGCSWNKCTFCAMYRDKNFRVRKFDELRKEIDWVAKNHLPPKKVFLADGDALIAPVSFLKELCIYINSTWPSIKRVSCYASPQALEVRSIEEMTMLKEHKLSLYYVGIESGHDEVLSKLEKGVDGKETVRVASKANEAGIKLSTMILLGAGGRRLSQAHAKESAKVISAIQPKFVSTLVMTPTENSPLFEEAKKGNVDELTPIELAAELHEFISGLTLKKSIFRSNHASNYLALAGSLPKDKKRLLNALENVLKHPSQAKFRPDWMRAL